MAYPTCRHILTTGVRCKSPSLVHQPLCFFHNRLHRRHRQQRERAVTPVAILPESADNAHALAKIRPETPQPRSTNLRLPPLEDAESIQVALSLVVAALAENLIEHPHARILLYGLQLASANVATARLQPYSANVIRQAVSTKAGLDLTPPPE